MPQRTRQGASTCQGSAQTRLYPCLPAGSQLFVQGGRNNFVLEDMFVLDLLRKEWTEALPGAKGPPARHGHLMTVHADHLYLYGGYDELGAYSDSMFRLAVPYGQAFTAARWAS